MQAALILFFFVSFWAEAGADWCFQSQVSCNGTCQGPERWGEVSAHCDGQEQSPINIVTKKAQIDISLGQFQLTEYNHIFNGAIKNTGYSVSLDLPNTTKISGGKLPATYKALQVHYHWGKDGGPGAEHTIDGEQYPMEMHIVYIKEEYADLSQAGANSNGIAVLGFLFEESQSDNKHYERLINALRNISQPTNSSMLYGVSLEMLSLPQGAMARYYRYSGSLTTPDCAQAVVWTLFEDRIPLSRTQLSAFSQLQFPDGEPMVNTFRPLQPLNGRQVQYSACHVPLVSLVLLMVSVLVSSAL
ncbi:carbonic anhydrase 4b [Nelusetta ayraudi]|uniref:carbonic anhydrase 4b n=1 Tax=Nelusetta ayraudi TaxID=303726 RepID=UPI003F7141BF